MFTTISNFKAKAKPLLMGRIDNIRICIQYILLESPLNELYTKKYVHKSLLYSCTLQELQLHFLIIACIYTAPIDTFKMKTFTGAI